MMNKKMAPSPNEKGATFIYRLIGWLLLIFKYGPSFLEK